MGIVMQSSNSSAAHPGRRQQKKSFSKPVSQKLVWPATIVGLLGKIPDLDIAKKLGVVESTVQKKRTKLGIPRPERKTDWKPEFDALLGTMIDKALAARLGVTVWVVKLRRQSLGIKSFRRRSRLRIRWTRQMLADLKTLSLKNFKLKHGVATPVAHAKRVELGIKSGLGPRRVRWTKRRRDRCL